MEELLEKYKEHPTVKLIYFPTEVNRKQSLLQGNTEFENHIANAVSSTAYLSLVLILAMYH